MTLYDRANTFERIRSDVKKNALYSTLVDEGLLLSLYFCPEGKDVVDAFNVKTFATKTKTLESKLESAILSVSFAKSLQFMVHEGIYFADKFWKK